MAKTREIVCIHYLHEGACDLGKDATFYGHCQTCKTYSPRRHGKPARIDTRPQRRERIFKKEKNNY